MTIRSQDTNAAITRDILTVAQLNQAVSHLLEDSFDACWVRGEISNFTNASSGHWYFTLKDDAASVKAVMFRSRAATTGFTPKAGDSVELKARVTLYEARGEYQLQVEQLRRAGLGTLFEAFVALKNKLSAEGLFERLREFGARDLLAGESLHLPEDGVARGVGLFALDKGA